MTNRISGDFNQEAVDAFRAAYAAQLSTPDEDGIANNSGLPTNIVSNTSPWIEHTGLWKYPSGKGPDEELKTPFNPSQYISSELIDGDDDSESLTDEEVDGLLNEILGDDEEEEEYE
jgi:hypothetical protein